MESGGVPAPAVTLCGRDATTGPWKVGGGMMMIGMLITIVMMMIIIIMSIKKMILIIVIVMMDLQSLFVGEMPIRGPGRYQCLSP